MGREVQPPFPLQGTGRDGSEHADPRGHAEPIHTLTGRRKARVTGDICAVWKLQSRLLLARGPNFSPQVTAPNGSEIRLTFCVQSECSAPLKRCGVTQRRTNVLQQFALSSFFFCESLFCSKVRRKHACLVDFEFTVKDRDWQFLQMLS